MMTNRRQTLKALAAMATVQIVPSRVLGLAGQTPPSGVLTRCVIGCGGVSPQHLLVPGSVLLGLCDVHQKRLDSRMTECKKRAPGVNIKGYKDFREMIATRNDIDIVHIATPPHWHALMAIEAAKAGKDIWCEKPMSRTIGEGMAMVKAVEKYNRIFRINTWYRYNKSGFYGMGVDATTLRKVALNDVLGWPLKITVSATTGFDWKIDMWAGKTNLPVEPVPEGLDYDMWLGPAPVKPYNTHRTEGGHFRGYWDYDGGGLGDMGAHYLDPVQYILGKDQEAPISVEIDSDDQDVEAVGTWRRIELTYADGCKIVLDAENKDKDVAYMEGPKGKIFTRLSSTLDTPTEKLIQKVKALPDPPAQRTDFHACVRSREKFCLNEQNAFWSGTMLNMCITAHRLNKNLKFDSKTLKFDNPAANALINQKMRGPWQERLEA
jgi:myo-inositol 2-dehydrogenase/D-chiro-inositol 1-dehydrogenase